jgi:aminoglycoside phosphotransferase (APT) family kinase protein
MHEDQATAAMGAAARRVLPNRRLAAIFPWPGGRTNRLFRLRFSTGPDAALRVYAGGPDALRGDVDLHRVLAGRIPVPEVLAVRADANPAFAIFAWVDGPLLQDLRRAVDPEVLAVAGRSLGATLARLRDFRPQRPAVSVTAGALLAAVGAAERDGGLEGDLARAVRALVADRRADLADCDADPVLVHGDLRSRKIIFGGPADQPAVAALIGWERSRTGSALIDLGSVLRDERPDRGGLEPHLSAGYREAGGSLPEGWRDLARLYDLLDVLRGLTVAPLADDARAELRAIVAATVANR